MKLSLKVCCLLISVAGTVWALSIAAEDLKLPPRTGPRPVTTDGIPHIQIDVQAVPELSTELLQRVSEIAGIELRGTIVGRAGSTGFWLRDETKLARAGSMIRGREFAHLHPDGSLHASLPPELARVAVDAGWAVPHPWAASKPGMQGFVMLYTPESTEQLDVVFQLVQKSYRFVTGENEL